MLKYICLGEGPPLYKHKITTSTFILKIPALLWKKKSL